MCSLKLNSNFRQNKKKENLSQTKTPQKLDDYEALWEHYELKRIQDTITDIIDPKILAPDDIIEYVPPKSQDSQSVTDQDDIIEYVPPKSQDSQSVMDHYWMRPPLQQGIHANRFWGKSQSPKHAQRVAFVGVQNTDERVNNHKSVDKKDAPKDSSMHQKPREAVKQPPNGSELKDVPKESPQTIVERCFPSFEDAKKIRQANKRCRKGMFHLYGI
jgi:hypothetical protein